jgi:hypothetical protein
LQIRTTLFYQAQRYWHTWANANPNPKNRGSNHNKLRDAVLSRDIIGASKLIKKHISQTTEIVIRYLENN